MTNVKLKPKNVKFQSIISDGHDLILKPIEFTIDAKELNDGQICTKLTVILVIGLKQKNTDSFELF